MKETTCTRLRFPVVSCKASKIVNSASCNALVYLLKTVRASTYESFPIASRFRFRFFSAKDRKEDYKTNIGVPHPPQLPVHV